MPTKLCSFQNSQMNPIIQPLKHRFRTGIAFLKLDISPLSIVIKVT